MFSVRLRGRRARRFEDGQTAMEGSMNPLDSITGTIVSGVILALILAALL